MVLPAPIIRLHDDEGTTRTKPAGTVGDHRLGETWERILQKRPAAAFPNRPRPTPSPAQTQELAGRASHRTYFGTKPSWLQAGPGSHSVRHSGTAAERGQRSEPLSSKKPEADPAAVPSRHGSGPHPDATGHYLETIGHYREGQFLAFVVAGIQGRRPETTG
jgi:hypothetical protein